MSVENVVLRGCDTTQRVHGIINMIECRDFLHDPIFSGRDPGGNNTGTPWGGKHPR